MLRGAELIRSGRVIGIPTETYYGLAADPDSPVAIEQLFLLKGRPRHKPILLVIHDICQLDRYVAAIPRQYQAYMDLYWPGPLTLVFPARKEVSEMLTGGTGTIGIRLTSHPIARALIAELGHPLTATSANVSAEEPSRTAQQVREYFVEKLGLVIDGGPAGEGEGSTVLALHGDRLCIARQGRVLLPGLPLCSEMISHQ